MEVSLCRWQSNGERIRNKCLKRESCRILYAICECDSDCQNLNVAGEKAFALKPWQPNPGPVINVDM